MMRVLFAIFKSIFGQFFDTFFILQTRHDPLRSTFCEHEIGLHFLLFKFLFFDAEPQTQIRQIVSRKIRGNIQEMLTRFRPKFRPKRDSKFQRYVYIGEVK
jgi:hypothetical protein